MAYIYVDRNATAVNKLQVAIKYTFDLEVRNVAFFEIFYKVKIHSLLIFFFFQGVHMFQP